MPGGIDEVLTQLHGIPNATAAQVTLAGYGDNQGAYTGLEWDNERVVWNPLASTDSSNWQPRQDVDNVDYPAMFAFGSAHQARCTWQCATGRCTRSATTSTPTRTATWAFGMITSPLRSRNGRPRRIDSPLRSGC